MSFALQQWVRPLAYCENDRYCQSILLNNIHNNLITSAPIWDDIRSLPTCLFPEIDIIYGGFPCQDISIAGLGKGLAGERSGLYWEIHRLAKEILPRYVFLENVPAICTKGGWDVVSSLAEMGYDCRWCVISAASIGACHRRERWFCLARHTDSRERHKGKVEEVQGNKQVADPTGICEDVADSMYKGCDQTRAKFDPIQSFKGSDERNWWKTEPDVGGTFNGLSAWLDENNLVMIKSHKCIMAYVKSLGNNGKADKENRDEILRTLRNGISTDGLQRSSSRCENISSEEILFSYLCKLSQTSEALDNLSSKSEEVQKSILRSLWAQQKFAGASHRSRHQKQYDREHPDSLQTLSRFLACDAEEAWTLYRWKNARPILSGWQDGWESGIARVVDGIQFRVDRIKALGNSVVPAQCKKAIEILMGLEK